MANIPQRIGTTNRWYHWLSCTNLVHLSRKQSNFHEVQLNLKLLHPLGVSDYDINATADLYGLTAPHPPDWVSELLSDQKFNLILHPTSRGSALEWGLEQYSALVKMLPKARSQPVLHRLGLEKGGYVLVTLHRPSNVDQPQPLAEILSALQAISAEQPVIFPVHPRTRKNMSAFDLQAEGVRLLEPLGYLDFLALTESAGLVLTDSGGIQEETTYLGVPCLTARPSTERPVTVEIGTNRLVASQRGAILEAVQAARRGEWGAGERPPLWDGRTAERIVEIMLAQG